MREFVLKTTQFLQLTNKESTMSKYNVTVVITLTQEVYADNESQALDIAKENFDIEMHLDHLESSTKFTKARIDDTDDESESINESFDSDEDEDDE